MMWLTVDEGSAVYVIPDNHRHDLDPEGFCSRCEPTIELADEFGPYRRPLVIHHEHS